MVENILGYKVFADDSRACVEAIVASLDAAQRRKHWAACFNPHSYTVASSNDRFSTALKSADWLVADGIGIVIGAKILGGNITGRTTGSDIFFGVMRALNHSGGRAFFLGASEETLEALVRQVSIDFPAVEVAGTLSPPFKNDFSDQDVDTMVTAVNASQSDVLWVGMTSPKQDLWIYKNLERLDIKFAAGIGAVFDFYVGRVKRSHPWFQKVGLEWLPRLMQEPRRLWRRVFLSGPYFLWQVIKALPAARADR